MSGNHMVVTTTESFVNINAKVIRSKTQKFIKFNSQFHCCLRKTKKPIFSWEKVESQGQRAQIWHQHATWALSNVVLRHVLGWRNLCQKCLQVTRNSSFKSGKQISVWRWQNLISFKVLKQSQSIQYIKHLDRSKLFYTILDVLSKSIFQLFYDNLTPNHYYSF